MIDLDDLASGFGDLKLQDLDEVGKSQIRNLTAVAGFHAGLNKEGLVGFLDPFHDVLNSLRTQASPEFEALELHQPHQMLHQLKLIEMPFESS